MLPLIFKLKIKDDKKNININCPMIVIYILLLPLYVICVVAYLLSFLGGKYLVKLRSISEILIQLPHILVAARGTEIKVNSKESNITLYIN